MTPGPLVEFPADEPERALAFWRGVLGIELEPRGPAEGAGWEASANGTRLGVHERGPGPGDTASLAYFTVENMSAARERVVAHGGTVVHAGDRWSICRDSEGSPFALAAG